jgi:uncharacterized protein (DUF952 family)
MTLPPHPKTIYKISDAAAGQAAERRGEFAGTPVDVADGYIHLSELSGWNWRGEYRIA